MQREYFGARAADRPDDGFTLVELMVVVLIIAILIAILIPTFTTAKNRANDRAMQSSLRNALTASKAIYIDSQDYTAATAARLNTEGVPVKFVDGATSPSGQNEVSVDPVSTTQMVLSGHSKSGTCFYVSDDVGTTGTRFAEILNAATCEATTAPVPASPLWTSSW